MNPRNAGEGLRAHARWLRDHAAPAARRQAARASTEESAAAYRRLADMQERHAADADELAAQCIELATRHHSEHLEART